VVIISAGNRNSSRRAVFLMIRRHGTPRDILKSEIAFFFARRV
jgi:hypothetical protein